MKKFISTLLICSLIVSLSGCNSSKNTESATSETTQATTTTEATTTAEPTTEATTEETTTETTWTDPVETDKIIVIECPSNYSNEYFQLFLELHPDFGYEFEFIEPQVVDYETPFKGSTADIIFVPGQSMIPDNDWMKHTDELMPYERVFDDLDSKLEDAGIPQAVVAAGRLNEDSPLYTLSVESSVQMFVYRKSVAQDVFGTDDPEQISEIIGGGSGNYVKFYEAGNKLKESGYFMSARSVDVFNPLVRANISNWIDMGNGTIQMTDSDYDLVNDVFSFGSECTNDPVVNSGSQYDFNEAWYGDKIFGFNGNMIDVSMTLQMNGQKAELNKDLGFCEAPVTTCSPGNTHYYVNKNTEHRKAIAEVLNWFFFDCSETGLPSLLFNGDERIQAFGIPIATKVFENSDLNFRTLEIGQNYQTKTKTLKDVKIYPWIASLMKKAAPVYYEDEMNYTNVVWRAILSTLSDIYGTTSDYSINNTKDLFKQHLKESVEEQSV